MVATMMYIMMATFGAKMDTRIAKAFSAKAARPSLSSGILSTMRLRCRSKYTMKSVSKVEAINTFDFEHTQANWMCRTICSSKIFDHIFQEAADFLEDVFGPAYA